MAPKKMRRFTLRIVIVTFGYLSVRNLKDCHGAFLVLVIENFKHFPFFLFPIDKRFKASMT
jgi:hypothetical protein